jgi:hypothetical protein
LERLIAGKTTFPGPVAHAQDLGDPTDYIESFATGDLDFDEAVRQFLQERQPLPLAGAMWLHRVALLYLYLKHNKKGALEGRGETYFWNAFLALDNPEPLSVGNRAAGRQGVALLLNVLNDSPPKANQLWFSDNFGIAFGADSDHPTALQTVGAGDGKPTRTAWFDQVRIWVK